jgi:LysR family hydrogen peroxide-inducible transcriptional activator
MEMHQLRYFLAVAKTGSFSRAAEECHVAQPSLSQQILKLEDELGEKLFERLRRRTTLTGAGELFRHRAERIVREVDEARREVQDLQGELRGKIELGVLPTIAPYLLPRIVRAFTEKYPAVEVIVHEEVTSRILTALEGNELDLALMSPPLPESRVQLDELFTEELLLTMPTGHPLIRKRTVTLEDLAPEKFILMQEGHCLGEQALQFCRERGFHPQITCRSAQVETIQALVEAGLGISLVPEMARRETGRHLAYRSLTGKKPSRAIVMVSKKGRKLSRAAEELKNFVGKMGAAR